MSIISVFKPSSQITKKRNVKRYQMRNEASEPYQADRLQVAKLMPKGRERSDDWERLRVGIFQ
jgi:hypothetical protein